MNSTEEAAARGGRWAAAPQHHLSTCCAASRGDEVTTAVRWSVAGKSGRGRAGGGRHAAYRLPNQRRSYSRIPMRKPACSARADRRLLKEADSRGSGERPPGTFRQNRPAKSVTGSEIPKRGIQVMTP